MDDDLKLLGYCMNKEGQYGDPIKLTNEVQVGQFLCANVMQHYELRVTDSEDSIVLHVVDQVLVFPVPEHGSKKNKWNSTLMKFETLE